MLNQTSPATDFVQVNTIIELNADDQAEVPTWTIGDVWTYEIDIYSDTEDAFVDISSDALNVSVENRSTLIHENKSVDVYVVGLSGDVYGTIDSSIFSGDVDGVIDGTVLIRQADLSIISTDITTYGILEWLFLDFDFDITSNATYYPCFEYIDFPIYTNESWNISSTVHQNSSFYVETFFDNQTESTSSMNGNASCDGKQSCSVPAGTFSCFHLISQGNGSIESWYNETVKSMVRLFVNQSNETDISMIYLNLTAYSLQDQHIDVTLDITPNPVDIDEPVTFSGTVVDGATGELIDSANVTIGISYQNKVYEVQTDESGEYSLTIHAPLIVDQTSTTYDIGSDGIIAKVLHNGNETYTISTLVVTGIAIDDMRKTPMLNYETNPVNISCQIYSVNALVEKRINITGPIGFGTSNQTLQKHDDGRYFFNQSLDVVGTYQYYIWAKECMGKTNQSAVYSFTVIADTLAPEIHNHSVSLNPQFANNSVNITAVVTDNVAVETVCVLVTDPIGQIMNYTMSDQNGLYYHDQIYTLIGNYSYIIWTQDTLGNGNISSLETFSIIPDLSAPVIIDHSPSFAFKNFSFTFNATITDNAAVNGCFVEYWYGSNAHVNVSLTAQQNNTWTHDIQVADTDDMLFYQIVAVDTSLNWNTTGVRNVTVLEYELLDVNQSVFNRGFPIRAAIDGDWAGAQNFTMNLNTVVKADLYLRKFGSPEFDLVVELRSGGPQGSLLDSITFPADQIESYWTWLEVDFSDQGLGAGSDVFLVCPPAPLGVTTSFGYEWGYAFGNQYDGGSFWFTRDGGSLWRDLPGSYEFCFKTYGHL